ncbi:MAG: FAD-dependent oxidoreductase [Desulfuromonadales bacterium]|jgi:predicted NAD/FAD-binding protein
MNRPAAEKGQNIAVIGGGVAGIVAAYLLQNAHRVSLFEQNDYLGGHTHTIEITDGPDAGLAVDTGFIVLNDQTYPLMHAFLARLEVGIRVSEMSFSMQNQENGLVYAGTGLSGLFAQRANLVRPAFYSFLLEIGRFCKQSRNDLVAGRVPPITLGEYLEQGGFSAYMRDNYLVPMAAEIWSTAPRRVTAFPVEPFLRFLFNHGLLTFRNRPNWHTVVGGSFAYVKAFQRTFDGSVFLNSGVRAVERLSDGVRLKFRDGAAQTFDQVVIATHADQALRLLADPDEEEQRLLGPWQYLENHTVLHRDASVLPRQKQAWASWNAVRRSNVQDACPVFVTYYMNRLQGFTARHDYCVTLNRPEPFPPESVIAEMVYHHPFYSHASMATQAELPGLNGRRRTWFCGSYFGYGFHEDAVQAGAAVGKEFGMVL